jgi:excisionase family DNA binding protein
VGEVAQATGLSDNAVYRAISDGELRASKLRGRLRVELADLDAWIESNVALAGGRKQLRVRWREGGRWSRERVKAFDRHEDAVRFDTDLRRRKQLRELALFEQSKVTLDELRPCRRRVSSRASVSLCAVVRADASRLAVGAAWRHGWWGARPARVLNSRNRRL